MPYVKNKIVVKVPKRSGFDKSHRNSGTLTCGTLTPLLCDEVVPGSRVSLKLNLATQLPPLVSDTYMNLKLKAEAFFCPSRLCCASFEDFFCDFPRRIYTNDDADTGRTSTGTFTEVTAAVPCFDLYSDTPASYYQAGSLLDYLGFKVNSIPEASPGVVTLGYSINAMPLIVYHLIWQEWYRNPRVQNPAFAPSLGLFPSYKRGFAGVPNFPFEYFHRSFIADGGATSPDNSHTPTHGSNASNLVCADGHNFFMLRQRNFGLDYFTGARPDAQQGSPAAVSFQVDSSGNGDITIAAIRAMNSLQQFRERNNIPSPRMVDQVKARYNANLADGVAQRPICIGSASYDVDSTGINQTAPADGTSPGVNPFDGVAAQYGRAYASGSDFIIKDFTANEPGYIMVLVSLVPEVTYSSGISPIFNRYRVDGSITDMACSLLQNVGDQPISGAELLDRSGTASPNVFGYQDRYADWMFKPNEAHGLFRDGQNLSSFVLQRSFNSYIVLGSSFLEIPKNYLAQVVSAPISNVDAWYDCLLDYKVSMPLAEFSIPSLQDPAYEHGESISLRRNGQVF